MLGGFYLSIAFLMSTGIVYVIFGNNDVKKVIALSIIQSSLIALFLSVGYVENSLPPIIQEGTNNVVYTDPVPSVLMLTAIVVGFCISALGYAFLIKIKQMQNNNQNDNEKNDNEQIKTF